jgi:hypothetical protein
MPGCALRAFMAILCDRSSILPCWHAPRHDLSGPSSQGRAGMGRPRDLWCHSADSMSAWSVEHAVRLIHLSRQSSETNLLPIFRLGRQNRPSGPLHAPVLPSRPWRAA